MMNQGFKHDDKAMNCFSWGLACDSLWVNFVYIAIRMFHLGYLSNHEENLQMEHMIRTECYVPLSPK